MKFHHTIAYLIKETTLNSIRIVECNLWTQYCVCYSFCLFYYALSACKKSKCFVFLTVILSFHFNMITAAIVDVSYHFALITSIQSIRLENMKKKFFLFWYKIVLKRHFVAVVFDAAAVNAVTAKMFNLLNRKWHAIAMHNF